MMIQGRVIEVRTGRGWVPCAELTFDGRHSIVRKVCSEPEYFENNMDALKRANNLIPKWIDEYYCGATSGCS
jgi:hypothetical protein